MLRVLDFREVERRVSLKESRIRELIAEGRFPVPTPLANRKLGFLESEVSDWIAARFAERASKPAGK